MKQYEEEVINNDVINEIREEDDNINKIENLDEIQSLGLYNESNGVENDNDKVISDNILDNLVEIKTANNKEYRLKGDYNFQIISLFDKKNDLTDKNSFNVYKINISHPNKIRNQEDFVFFERNYNTVAFNDIINFIGEKEKIDVNNIIQKKKYISGCKISDIILIENEKKDPFNNNQSKYILKNFSIKYGDEKIQLFSDDINQLNKVSNKFSEEWLLKTFSPERILKAGDTVSYGGQNKSIKHNRYKLEGDFDILNIKRDKAITPKDTNKAISWIPVEIQSRDESIPEKDRRFHILVIDKMIDDLDFLKNYKAFDVESPDDLFKKMTLRDIEINCQTFLGNNKKGETIELASFNLKKGIMSLKEYNVDLILSLNSKKKQPLFRLDIDPNSMLIFKDSGCTLNDIIGDNDKKIITDSFITIDGDFDIKSLRENMSPIAISDKAIVLTVKVNGKDGLEKIKEKNLDLYSLITNFGKKNKLASDKNSLVYNISLENSEIIAPLLFILSNYDSDNMKELKTKISSGDYPTSGIRISNPFLFIYDEPRNHYNRVIIQGGDIVLKNNDDEEVIYSVKSSDFSNFDFEVIKENNNFYISKISIIADKIGKENNNNAFIKLGIFAESQLKDGDVVNCVYYNQKLEVPTNVLERDIRPMLAELKNRTEKQIKMPKVEINNINFFKNEKNNLVLEKIDCNLIEKTTKEETKERIIKNKKK